MSVQFSQHPHQMVHIDDDLQHLNDPNRVPLERMTSRSDRKINPYAQVQEQLTHVQLDSSREEHAERIRIRRIFDRVRQLAPINESLHALKDCLIILVRHKP